MFSKRPRESRRDHKHKFARSSKDKLSKLIASDSDTEGDSEHELSYYTQDRVKLMKEVLKIIKPRKIKSMAPDCMKNLELQEINSMLLEELLGISNQRLRHIFEGKILDEESSTDEDQSIDVISLDDISDDDFVVISDEEVDTRKTKHKRKKIKEEPKEKLKKIKKEKPDKDKKKETEKIRQKTNSKEKEMIGEENLMSVLELLELQARARAIRSQLELESKKKQDEKDQSSKEKKMSQENGQEDDDEIIMEVPLDVEIVITSSESEKEEGTAWFSKHRQSLRAVPKNVSEHTNVSTVQTNNKESAQDGVNGPSEKNTCNISDKEDGEVSDSETHKSASSIPANLMNSEADVNNMDGSNVDFIENLNSNSSSKIDSDSSSNDNLQIVMKREKRRKRRETLGLLNDESILEPVKSQDVSREVIELKNGQGIRKSLEAESIEGSETVNREIKSNDKELNQIAETPDVGCSTNPDEGNKQRSFDSTSSICSLEQNNHGSYSKSSKIEAAIKEFISTQPCAQDNSDELMQLEEEKKKKEEKAKREKEKRLKGFKNKFHSFKQDIAVECSNVTVLENIIIKPTTLHRGENSRPHLEDSDDLVINVDQDDLDCIICD